MAALFMLNHQRRPNPRVFKERLALLDHLRDAEIVERYRLSRAAILDLFDLIKDDISPQGNRSHPVPPLTKLLVTLRYLAKGDFYSEVADLHGVSRSSVSRHVWQEEISNTKRKFFRIAGIPNCLGAIDGTLIPIIAPAGPDEPVFVSRKGFHAFNVQSVVDADLRFTDVVASWPGSTHDATVFNMCGLKQWLEREQRGWIFGDSGYPLRPYLMTPKLICMKAVRFYFSQEKIM